MPNKVKVITIMTGLDVTGLGVVSQSGEVISGGESGDPNGAVMTMTDMTVTAGTATVCNRFTVPTNV